MNILILRHATCCAALFGMSAALAAAPASAAGGEATDTLRRIDYVRPLVGTDGYGNVYPGAQVPFGGVQLSPDTDRDFTMPRPDTSTTVRRCSAFRSTT